MLLVTSRARFYRSTVFTHVGQEANETHMMFAGELAAIIERHFRKGSARGQRVSGSVMNRT